MKRIAVLGSAILLAFGTVSYSANAEAHGWRGGRGVAAAAIVGGFVAAGIAANRYRYGYGYYPRRGYFYGPRYYYGSGYYVGRPYYRPRVRYYVRPYAPRQIYRYYGPRREYWRGRR